MSYTRVSAMRSNRYPLAGGTGSCGCGCAGSGGCAPVSGLGQEASGSTLMASLVVGTVAVAGLSAALFFAARELGR